MLVVILLSSLLLALPSADSFHPLNEHNMMPILEDDRQLVAQVKCYLDQGPCAYEASLIKEAIGECFKTACSKYSATQKVLIRTGVIAVKTKLPQYWAPLMDKYDPEKKYQDNIKKIIEGINLTTLSDSTNKTTTKIEGS